MIRRIPRVPRTRTNDERSFFARRAGLLVLILPLLAACESSPTVPGLDCPDPVRADPDCPPTDGAVEGRVIDGETGEPIVGALVATSPSTGTALSDGEGRFEIEGIDLTEGDVALAVTAVRSGYVSDSEVVILRSEAPLVAVELALSRATTPPVPTGQQLIVRVEHRDSAFAGATVDVLDVSGAVLASATSDANGFAVVVPIDPGTYTVRATATIAGRPFAATEGVQVSAGRTAFVELELRQVF